MADLMKAIHDIAGLTTMALVTRLWWVWSSAWIAGDSSDYLSIARNLVLHHIFSLNNAADGQLTPTAHRPPLYPILIAVLWWTDSPPILAILLVPSLLGAASATHTEYQAQGWPYVVAICIAPRISKSRSA
jgi:hypothetical protein